MADLKPFLALTSGGTAQFSVAAKATIPIENAPQSIEVGIARFNEEAFDLDVVHRDYEVHVRRRAEATALALPKHGVVYLGRGDVDPQDNLRPAGLTARLVSSGTRWASYLPLASATDPATLSLVLTGLLNVQWDAAQGRWSVGDNAHLAFGQNPPSLSVTAGKSQVEVSVATAGTMSAVDAWDGLRCVDLDRVELERQLARGVRRALEILAPSTQLTSPDTTARKVAHGELRWIDGQRVAILSGTPEQVGRAHGELLRVEAQRCVDSVLHTFGTVHTLTTGRWFRHDLETAYARLSPHIPQDHQTEVAALASSLQWDPHTAKLVNVFPELFHCSGFAVFGSATADGKLYHGRVLDYMTEIGLQDAATTFIVQIDGKIPFANIGYAGFVGSVSGMNAQAISLGEMGGRGEGHWDGVPMSNLMRKALEECSTLDEVMNLWKTSPRTCEYYYVFADGKTNRAVGVAAVPESVEFILPGQTHPQLGEGIADAVVLSAGSRLEELRARVTQRHGQIDASVGQWLMSRPVAMKSNLHNVLFVPADGVFYVANADHKHPAAERPYVRLNLRELLPPQAGPASVSAAAQ
jgi:hypothetical protein